MNYVRPGIKHGVFTAAEDELIIKLHDLLGNRIAMKKKLKPKIGMMMPITLYDDSNHSQLHEQEENKKPQYEWQSPQQQKIENMGKDVPTMKNYSPTVENVNDKGFYSQPLSFIPAIETLNAISMPPPNLYAVENAHMQNGIELGQQISNMNYNHHYYSLVNYWLFEG